MHWHAVVMGLDADTERRLGERLSPKGRWRVTVRSAQACVDHGSVLHRACLMPLMRLPWIARSHGTAASPGKRLTDTSCPTASWLMSSADPGTTLPHSHSARTRLCHFMRTKLPPSPLTARIIYYIVI